MGSTLVVIKEDGVRTCETELCTQDQSKEDGSWQLPVVEKEARIWQ